MAIVGAQHRQRNGERDQQAGAQAAKHQEEHRRHQEPALEQVLADGAERPGDEHAAVVHDVHDGRPAETALRTSAILALSRFITSRAFSPRSIWAIR